MTKNTSKKSSWNVIAVTGTYQEVSLLKAQYVSKGYGEPSPSNCKQVKINRCGSNGLRFALKTRVVTDKHYATPAVV